MKIPEGTKRVLTVCTGGKDRSPIMAEYFRSLGYEARAVGISEYHTGKNGTTWCDTNHVNEADLIVCVSTVHEAWINGMLRGCWGGTCKREIRVVGKLAEDPDGRPRYLKDENVRDWVWQIMTEAFPVSGGR